VSVDRGTATWLWDVGGDTDAATVVAFATGRRLREVYLHVPRAGPDERTSALAARLRRHGIAVSCLGGDPSWTVRHDAALRWMADAMRGNDFDGVHLDVEPWALPDWPRNSRSLMTSYGDLVEKVAAQVPLGVDLVPWLADTHAAAVTRVVRTVDSVTMLAYRDRAAQILDVSATLRAVCVAARRRYRVGVETQPPGPDLPAASTFGDDGSAVLDREMAAVSSALADDGWCDGIAVHHLRSWRRLVSRP
jgi:hypothetical protein